MRAQHPIRCWIPDPKSRRFAPEYAATIELWFSRIEDGEALPTDLYPEDFEGESEDEPNGFDGDSPSEC